MCIYTHVSFYGLWGLSMCIMVFILYKLFFYQPTSTLHLNLPLTVIFVHFLIFKKLILKAFWIMGTLRKKSDLTYSHVWCPSICTHTRRSGQSFMLQRPGSSWGFGALLSRGIEGGASAVHSLPPPKVYKTYCFMYDNRKYVNVNSFIGHSVVLQYVTVHRVEKCKSANTCKLDAMTS